MPTPDRLLAIFPAGHPVDDDHASWLRERLARVRLEADTLAVGDGRAEASGTWAGMPCDAQHLDDLDQGPLFLSFSLLDFQAAMALPLMSDDGLPPPLAAFTAACRSLSPTVAVLTSDPLDAAEVVPYVVEMTAEIGAGPSADLCERPYTALYLSSFDIVMLEDEQPLLAMMRRLDVAGGAVFFPAGTDHEAPGA